MMYESRGSRQYSVITSSSPRLTWSLIFVFRHIWNYFHTVLITLHWDFAASVSPRYLPASWNWRPHIFTVKTLHVSPGSSLCCLLKRCLGNWNKTAWEMPRERVWIPMLEYCRYLPKQKQNLNRKKKERKNGITRSGETHSLHSHWNSFP